jgi:hypothetical protein
MLNSIQQLLDLTYTFKEAGDAQINPALQTLGKVKPYRI